MAKYTIFSNIISGSNAAIASITGSLFGSSSYASTASWAQNFVTSSVTSASYAATASSADNFNVRTSLTASNALINGNITAQTLVVQTITSSVEYITGSSKFGTLLTDTHQFTGSVSVSSSLNITGQVNASGITSSLFGTASWAQNFVTSSVTSASYAATASSGDNFLARGTITGASTLTLNTYLTLGLGGNNDANTVSLGRVAGPTTGATRAVAIGYSALNQSTGIYNIAIGYGPWSSLGAGGNNIGIGQQVGYLWTTGNSNTLIIPSGLGLGITSGNYNTIIGTPSGSYSANSNNLVILADGNGNNRFYYDGTNINLNASNSNVIVNANLRVSGSSIITGSLTAINGITGSLFGTASWAQNFLTSSVTSASYAATASYFLTSSVASSSFATSASFASTSSWALNFLTSSVTSASYAQTASYFITSSVTNATSASYAATSSWALNFLTSSVTSASYAATASFVSNAFIQGGNSFGTTALLGTNDTQNLQLETNNAVRLAISSSGYIGVGTSTPQANIPIAAFDVNGLIRARSGIQITGDSATIVVTASRSDNSQYGTLIYNGWGDFAFNKSLYLGYTPSTNTSAGNGYFFAQGGIGINKTGSLNGSFDLNGNATITGSLNVTNGITSSLFGTSSWAINAATASYFITSSVTNATSASYAATSSWALNFITSSVTSASFASTASYFLTSSVTNATSASYAATSSWALNFLTSSVTNATSASFASTSSWALNFITSSVTSASFATTASYILQAVSASFASTASSVNTLNQSVLITGSLTIGTSSLGSNENTLVLGPAPAGGAGEGGQLLLQAKGDSGYTSASMLDTYQNKFRVLRGTNASSDALVTQWDLHTKQMQLPAYTSVSSFPGTAVANLAVDSTGSIITVSTSGGSVFPYTGVAQINGGLIVTGSITASNAIYAQANGTMYFRGGDDAEFWDINVVNTVGIYGQQNQDRAGIKLGSAGPTLFGSGSNLGIGTITPSNTLQVVGGVTATSFTGSLQGTASWALNFITSSVTNATSASYAATSSWALNFLTSSVTSASYAATASWALNFITSSVTSASYAATASYFITSSVTNATSASYAATSSWALNFITSSVTNAISASFAATASSADSFNVRTSLTASNLLVSGTITAQTLVVQTITSSVDFITGSSKFGTLLTNTHQFTGSVSISSSLNVTGQLTATGITSSLFGTSSWAINAATASYFLTSSVTNATSASFASTSSWALNFITSSVTSASFASTASYFLTSSVTNATSASFAATASWALNFITSSVTSASFASTSSLALNFITSSVTSASFASTSSLALNFITSSVTSASFAATASYFITSSVTSASYARTSSYANASSTVGYTIGGSQIYYSTVTSAPSPSTVNVFTNSTGSFTCGFYNYTVYSASNARAGNISVVWTGTTASYTDYSTTDIGDTFAVTASVSIVSSQVQFNVQVPSSTAGWNVKATATYL
jgi:hypothetical protein